MSLCGLPKYFLAANSADGFINGFSSAFSAKDNWKAYLIKGGPGTGKSSFMKKIAYFAHSKGMEVELVFCSSDPDSLDGVILKGKKIIILDATSPHTLDPVYPAVCEELLDFGAFWNTKKIEKQREHIIRLTDKNKELHSRASRMLSAIGQLMRNDMKISLIATDIDKVFNFGEKLAKRYLKNKNQGSKEWIRYLGGVTPKGYVFYGDTIDCYCENKIIICDELYTVSNILLSVVRDIALSYGYEIITVRNNFLPREKIEHILIPEISLAFCTKNCYNNVEADGVRQIHAQRFMNRAVIKENRGKLVLSRKLINGLINGTVATLYEAKEMHDRLESYYIKAMDFESLNGLYSEFVSEILTD